MRSFLSRTALALSLILFGGSLSARADQIAVSQFKLLNSNDNSTTLDPSEAQNLLNVDVTPSGKTIKKRQGYGSYKLISPSAGMHGGYHAFNTTGSDYQLWGTSTSLYGIVADGTPTKIVSSATLNATWDCADTQGSSYCVDSARDAFIRTDGSTLTNWYTSPLGTMVEATPDRVVVAGVAASPNTLFVSQSNTFTNYVTGVNATDAFTEVIAAPGSHLTHIRWGCQKLLWWKDQSFGYFDFDDQYSAQVKTISDIIGTFDNTSAIDPGGNVWFRGQDGHTYEYDCSSLQRMTVDITPQIQTSGKRTSNLWQQTTQADWQSGAIAPTASLSATLSAGDVVPSSFSTNEYSSASGWASGTSSNFAVGTSSLSLLTNNSGSITDNSFESGSGINLSANWTVSDNSGCFGSCITDDNIFLGDHVCGTVGAKSGTWAARIVSLANFTLSADILDANSGTALASTTFAYVRGLCTWTSKTISSSGFVGRRVKYKFRDTTSGNSFTTASSYILGGDVSFWVISDESGASNARNIWIDLVTGGSSTITSGSFTSQRYDMGTASTTWQITDNNFTVNTSTPLFSLLTATATTGPWTQVLTSSQTNALSNRYAKFTSTISIGSTDNALSYISSFTIVARSSGTLYSQWKNAPNWSAWGTFNPTSQDNGGSHTFYVRASTSPQSVTNSTVTWVAQSVNAQVATSTAGVYFQVRDDFTVPAATNTPTLNDFTVNWFEGAASDQAYMLYFDNAIWESVAYGTGVSSNTYIFRYDLINQGWGLYSFGAGGMLNQGNRLYFGSVGDGNIFQFGSGASDNGTAINAFWKSKDFTGNDPFLQSSLSNIDVFAKKDTGTTLTSTYTTDTSTATAYSIVLSTSNAIVQSRKLLPSGKLGYVFNFQLGDNSISSQWEVLGVRMGYTQLPYRPTP